MNKEITARIEKYLDTKTKNVEVSSGKAWFDSLTPTQKKQYIKLHPNSKLGKTAAKKSTDKSQKSKDAFNLKMIKGVGKMRVNLKKKK